MKQRQSSLNQKNKKSRNYNNLTNSKSFHNPNNNHQENDNNWNASRKKFSWWKTKSICWRLSCKKSSNQLKCTRARRKMWFERKSMWIKFKNMYFWLIFKERKRQLAGYWTIIIVEDQECFLETIPSKLDAKYHEGHLLGQARRCEINKKLISKPQEKNYADEWVTL